MMMNGVRLLAFALLLHGSAQAARGKAEESVAAVSGGITPGAPIGDPAEWFTSEDYPADAMRSGSTGMVNLTVRISESGNPSDCIVTESSGAQALDDAACALMMARAHFTPGHDAKGNPVGFSYHRKIRWQMPDDREIWTLDQIRFPAPKDTNVLKDIAGDHSMAAVAARLTKLGIAVDRSVVQLDTGVLPNSILEQINKLPATEPFVIPQPGVVTINVVTARQPMKTGAGGKRVAPPPSTIATTLSYDVDPEGKASNCAIKGETPSWAGNPDGFCQMMEKSNPIFAPDPTKQGRHITITTQLSVTLTKP